MIDESTIIVSLKIIIGILIAILLIGNAFMDLKNRIISVKLCLVVTGIGLAIIVAADMRSPGLILLGLIPGLFMILVSIISKGKVGIGDGIVITALGLLWGLETTFLAVLLAMVILAVISIIMLASKRWKKGRERAFIPFLCGASGIVALTMGQGL